MLSFCHASQNHSALRSLLRKSYEVIPSTQGEAQIKVNLTLNCSITAQFVVSCCAFCRLRRDFGFFFSVNHFSESGVNANHIVMCSPSLAENDSRLRSGYDLVKTRLSESEVQAEG